MAFDLGMMLNTAPAENTIQQIPCDKLQAYHNHMFALYEGERLEDMVESIRSNGVLTPLVVQPLENGMYEILIGHNRWNASKIAGMETVPAIIKQGLSEDEAEMYVIESNLIQRGFENLRISEQAAVIAQRQSEVFSQGKRNDIVRELQILDGTADTTLSPVDIKCEKTDNNAAIGEEYGMSRASVARLLRINKLIPELKQYVDTGKIGIYAAVNLSYISEKTQKEIADLADTFTISIKKSEILRSVSDEQGNIPDSELVKIFAVHTDDKQVKPKTVKISSNAYSRYFKSGTKPAEVSETIEKALDFYFANRTEEKI